MNFVLRDPGRMVRMGKRKQDKDSLLMCRDEDVKENGSRGSHVKACKEMYLIHVNGRNDAKACERSAASE